MDLYALAAVVGCLALLVGVVVGGLLKTFSWVLDARDKRDEAVDERHVKDLALRDATILSLRSELEMVRQKGADGAAAAEGQLEVASRVADAPAGPDGDRRLWDPSGSDPAPGGGPAG
jgi:hypothetical protein